MNEKNKASRLPVTVLFLWLAAALHGACGKDVGASDEPLRFSAIPDQNNTELMEKYGRVATYLSGALGVPVEYVPAASYEASVTAFKNGDIQLAWFGGYTHVQARAAVPGARAIAQGKVDPQFKSYFVANPKAGIQPSKDFPMALRGKNFTFGSDSSTSGRLMPEHFIRKFTGQSPQEFFGAEMHFSGDHTQTAKLVEAGSFDAGALNYKVYDEMVRDGKLDAARCVIIWETPTYPDYNWTAHPALETRYGAGFTDRLQEALVGIEEPALLLAMQREEGLIQASNADFDPIEDVARKSGLLR